MSRPHLSLSDNTMLSMSEVVGLLVSTRTTVLRHIEAGRLPAAKIGGQWRIARWDLEQFARPTNQPTGDAR